MLDLRSASDVPYSFFRLSFGCVMEPAVAGKLFGFGVWRAPVLVDGLPAIWAVDSFGNVRKVRKIRPGDDEQELGDRLFAWLRANYPERRLELVPDAPEPELVEYHGRMIDKRLLTMPGSPLAMRAYRDRLVKAAAQHASVLSLRRKH